MDTSLLARLQELEEENRRLKKMFSEERLVSEVRKEALEGKYWSRLDVERWPRPLNRSRTKHQTDVSDFRHQ